MTDLESEFESKTDLGLPPSLGKEPTLYEALSVSPTATRLQIREAYLRMKSTYGPGSAAVYSLMNEDDAQEAMGRVEEAFRILNDDFARSKYDQEIGLESPVNETVATSYEDVLEHSARTEQLRGREPSGSPKSSESLVGGQEGYVRTMRSTLPIIKTKACNTFVEDVQARYLNIIEESDPGDGDLFRKLREAAGVSPVELQERTKISVDYIESLEANRFDRLPQLIYVKGFLRSYLRYLNVPDAERLVGAFAKRFSHWLDNQKS